MTRRLALLLPALACVSCDGLGDPQVVTLGSETITLGELRELYADLRGPDRFPLGTREARRAFVNAVVEDHLLLRHGRECLPEAPDVSRDLAEGRRKYLAQRLQVVATGEPRPSPDRAREARERMQVAHLVRAVAFASREEAEVAHERILAGDSLDDVARGETGVRLAPRWVQWTPVPDPLADTAAGLEVGETSPPVLVDYRYQLVQVTDRQSRELPEEDVDRRVVRELLLRDRSEQTEALSEELRTRYRLTIHDEAIARLASDVGEAVLNGVLDPEVDWAVPSGSDPDLVLAEWSSGAWKVRDYVHAVRRLPPGQRPHRVFLEQEVRRFCEFEVTNALMEEEAVRRGLADDWWARRALKRAEREALIGLARERITADAEPEDAAVDSLYSTIMGTHPHQFRHPTRARVVRFDFRSRQAALRELERIREAGSAVERIGEILEGDLGFEGAYQIMTLTEGGTGIRALEEQVFRGEPGTISGPFQLGDGWILLETLHVEPSRELTLKEAVARVRETLRRDARATVLRDWLENRRVELGFHVDEQALDALGPSA